jgi:hypothetical protein
MWKEWVIAPSYKMLLKLADSLLRKIVAFFWYYVPNASSGVFYVAHVAWNHM